MSGCSRVENVEQTATPALLISFPPNLSFSRLSSIMVTALPCLSRLIFFVKILTSAARNKRGAQNLLSGKSQN